MDEAGKPSWRKVLLVLALAMAMLAGLASTAAAQAASDPVFSIVVLPDPQNYSQYYPAIFSQQTQWIVDHQAERNIQFVIGLGDMVNNPGSTTEWQNADQAVRILDTAGIPYAMAIGNHDYDGFNPPARQTAAFNKWFGSQRYAASPDFKANLNGSNENFYETFTVGSTEYLLLVLEYYPRDAALEWAEGVIAQYPNDPVILTTHSLMYLDSTRVDECDTNDMSASNGNNGDALWKKFISQHENIFLALSGHISNKPYSKRTDAGMNGRLVMQTLQDWQDYPNGGDGWLRIYTFHPDANRVDVETYSPYRDSTARSASLTDSDNQFSFPISGYASSASGPGTIAGKVRTVRSGTNGGCQPVAGVTVAAAGYTATTDSKGAYSLSLPAPNSYSVAVSDPAWTAPAKDSSPWPALTDQVELFATALSCTASANTVKICSPGSGSTVSPTFTVDAAAASTVSITMMQVYLDGVAKKTVYASTLTVPISASAGSHRLTVQAKDANGVLLKTTEYVTVAAENSPPPPPPPPPPSCTAPANGVTICAPTAGATVASPVTITAMAQSSTALIKYTQIYLDGTLKQTINSASISVQLAMASGTHRLTVQAKDANGVLVKSTINITVQ